MWSYLSVCSLNLWSLWILSVTFNPLFSCSFQEYVAYSHTGRIIPAIWFRYDLSPITVKYTERRQPLYRFITTVSAKELHQHTTAVSKNKHERTYLENTRIQLFFFISNAEGLSVCFYDVFLSRKIFFMSQCSDFSLPMSQRTRWFGHCLPYSWLPKGAWDHTLLKPNDDLPNITKVQAMRMFT